MIYFFNLDSFIIRVVSPSEYYYTDIFWSFSMSPKQAWKLYVNLLNQKKVEVDGKKKDDSSILSLIPDNSGKLVDEFISLYTKYSLIETQDHA